MTTPQLPPAPNRRALLSGGIAAAAGLAATTFFSPSTAFAVNPPLRFSDIPGTGDIKVLNFALALEDLETSLYIQALKRLTTGGSNALGKTIPGLGLSSTQREVILVKKFGQVEREHRDLLRSTLTSLGGPVIQPFKYDFGIQSKSRRQVLELIHTAEKNGTGAYLGGVKFLATRTYLQIAAAIQGTEARHTAVFADLLGDLFGIQIKVAPTADQFNATDQPIPPNTVLARISPFIVI